MLEIASEIALCLLIAALIGFIIGFSIGKWGAKKSVKTTETVPVNVTSEDESTQPSVKTEAPEIDEEVEIPTQNAIASAVEAIEELETSEEEIIDETSMTEGEKPELLEQARESGKDKLSEIKGIGPKVEEQLNAAGIYHFDQIANWTEENIKWLEQHTTFAHRAKKDLWVNQAKKLV